jgi:hypothetical protein
MRNSAPAGEQREELGMSQPTAAGDTAPASRRGVAVTRPGGLDALEIQDVPVPARKPGWVRIRVKAFGVNKSEVTTRKGDRGGVWDRHSNLYGWTALLGERRGGPDVSQYAAPARAEDTACCRAPTATPARPKGSATRS